MNNKYKTGLRRFAAAMIDFWLFVIPMGIFEFFLSRSGYDIYTDIFWSIISTMFFVTYSVFFHYHFGKTFGKGWLGLKLVDVSEKRLMTFKQTIFRDFLPIITSVIALGYSLFDIFSNPDNKTFFHGVIVNYFDLGYMFWIVLELVTMIFNKKRKALQDYLAKSVVIKD